MARGEKAHRRVEMLLARLDIDDWLPPDELRLLRVVEVLEHVGTPEARQLLEDLADQKPPTEVTEQARASLGRLKGR